MDIRKLREHFENNTVKWTTHGLERIHERDISIKDVKCCITNGEVIEDYPNDYPHPSALVCGKDVVGRTIHAVCGLSEDNAFFITAYVPGNDVFENDLKTRRSK